MWRILLFWGAWLCDGGTISSRTLNQCRLSRYVLLKHGVSLTYGRIAISQRTTILHYNVMKVYEHTNSIWVQLVRYYCAKRYFTSRWLISCIFIKIIGDILHILARFVNYFMGWTVQGSNPGGGEIFRICPDRPWGPPSLLYNGYRVFPGGWRATGTWRWPLTPF